MRILVTGASGLIGSRLVVELSKEHDVMGVSLFDSGKMLAKDCKWGDVRDSGLTTQIRSFGPDLVVHLAAIATNSYANLHPEETFSINAGGTVNMVEICRGLVPQPVFVLASSSEVYGGATDTVDEKSPIKATTPYAASKIAAEEYVRCSGLRYVIMRPFNTYGRALIGVPVAVPDKAIVSAVTHRRIELWDPRPQRDFMFREDHVDAYRTLIRQLAEEGGQAKNLYGETFVFGTGIAVSIGDLFDLIVDLVQPRDVVIVNKPQSRPGDIPVLKADCSKAREMLGWIPKWSLRSGLEQAYSEWQRRLQGANDGRVPVLDASRSR